MPDQFKITIVVLTVFLFMNTVILGIIFYTKVNTKVEPTVKNSTEVAKTTRPIPSPKIEETSTSSTSTVVTKITESKITETTPTTTKPKVTPKEPVKIIEKPKVIPKVETGLNNSVILQAHNAVRKEHSLSSLVWSANLAKGAQIWSDQLQKENCVMRHDYNSGYGENIFWKNMSGGDISSLISVENEAVTWWADEEKNYSYSDNTCDKGKVCGHYTQLVWADTTEVGCGVSSCITGNERTDIWVCRYNPAGNMNGEPPY